MESLGDKLVHLSLEIEDRAKSAELLSQLINDQSSRHLTEISNLENEKTATFQKLASDRGDILSGVSNAIQSLIERKQSLETHRDDLLATHQQAEKSKKKNLDASRREIEDEKEAAHQSFKREKSQREKAFYDARVLEIDKLTWKGIEPNIARLVKNHREKCDEIKADLLFSKKKLELQCENELTERVQAYQRNEQQPNNLVNKRNEFFYMLDREQNEHALSLVKLKERLVQDEEATKNIYSLQLETLAKDYSVALSKNRCSSSVQRLAQDLSAKRSVRQQELESNLSRLGKDAIAAKAQWEVTWMTESAARVEEKISNNMENLLSWRSYEIDSLIRKSLLDQEHYESSSDDDDSQLISSAELQESIKKQHTVNNATKEKLVTIARSKADLLTRVDKLEKDISIVNGKLNDITSEFESKKVRHMSILNETSNHIEASIQSTVRLRFAVEQQVKDDMEKYDGELRRVIVVIMHFVVCCLIAHVECVSISDHNKAKENLTREHERKLGDLETYATKSTDDIRQQLQRVQNSIKEQHAILARSQALASRYTEI
jgi:hypothetical protein